MSKIILTVCPVCGRLPANRMAMPFLSGPICSLTCAREIVGAEIWFDWFEEESRRRLDAMKPAWERKQFRIVCK
ncbi:hypothetical protein L0152_07365 [bacterium]|nr:hypothetical protein [bacterium]